MRSGFHDQREWLLSFGILIAGILFLQLVASAGVEISPTWSVSADMASNIDPDQAYIQSIKATVAPILPEIMTPPAWSSFVYEMSDSGTSTIVPLVTFSNSPTLPSSTSNDNPTPLFPSVTPTSNPIVEGPTRIPSPTPVLSPTPSRFPTLTPGLSSTATSYVQAAPTQIATPRIKPTKAPRPAHKSDPDKRPKPVK